MKKAVVAGLFFLFTVTFTVWAGESLPFAAGICVNKAQTLAQKGDIGAAVGVLEAFEARRNQADPDEIEKKGYAHYYIYFLLGNFYVHLARETYSNEASGLHQNAIKNYETCVTVHPGFSPAWLNLAKLRYESDQFNTAAAAFLKGYDTASPPRAIHLYYAAVCRFHAREYDGALSVFKRIQKNHPEKMSLEWKETLVNIYFSLDRHKDALPLVEELARMTDPEKRKQWQEILLYQYLSLNMKGKALEYARYLTQTDTLESRWWKALCHIHLGNDHLEDGLAALIIYGYLTPMTPEESLLAADLYLSLEVPARASDIYGTVLETVDETKKEIVFKLVNALSMTYESDKALAVIEKGLSQFNDDRLLRIKGRILYEKKEYEQAADVYESLSRALKKPGHALLMLGYSAMNCNRLEQATQAFLKAKRYKKQEKAADTALRQIETLIKNGLPGISRKIEYKMP